MDKQNLISLAEDTINLANELKIDYADVRVQSADSTQFKLQNKELEGTVSGSSFGIGIRVIHKGKQGFFYSNNSDIKFILNRALTLAKLNPSKEKIKLAPAKVIVDLKDEFKNKFSSIDISKKLDIAKSIVGSANLSNKIKNVTINYSDADSLKIFANTDGTKLSIPVNRTRIVFFISAKEGDKIEEVGMPKGGFDFKVYNSITELVKEKAKLVLNQLHAKSPKGGKFDVVMDPNVTGLLAHEALGHASEADIVLMGDSCLKNKMGSKIASNLVTIYDSPIEKGKWGSYKYDDEGVPTQRTDIIKNGVLKTFLHSRVTAAKLKSKLTGNARAESYAFIPLVRMSNTCFDAGDHSFNELIKEVKKGYYLCGMGGGQVNTLQGSFAFASEYTQEIVNGRLGRILKECTFSGKILETLKNVVAVGKDEDKIDTGYCGKGQYVPVGTGKLHLAVKGLHIGGR